MVFAHDIHPYNSKNMFSLELLNETGYYNITLFVYDESGNSTIDSTIVLISPDLAKPVI